MLNKKICVASDCNEKTALINVVGDRTSEYYEYISQYD